MPPESNKHTDFGATQKKTQKLKRKYTQKKRHKHTKKNKREYGLLNVALILIQQERNKQNYH